MQDCESRKTPNSTHYLQSTPDLHTLIEINLRYSNVQCSFHTSAQGSKKHEETQHQAKGQKETKEYLNN